MVQPVVIAAIIVVALSSLTTFFMAIYLCKLNEWLCFNVQRDGSGNVIKTAEVQKANNERQLKVYGWIFDIHTGKLIDLNIDFDEIFS